MRRFFVISYAFKEKDSMDIGFGNIATETDGAYPNKIKLSRFAKHMIRPENDDPPSLTILNIMELSKDDYNDYNRDPDLYSLSRMSQHEKYDMDAIWIVEKVYNMFQSRYSLEEFKDYTQVVKNRLKDGYSKYELVKIARYKMDQTDKALRQLITLGHIFNKKKFEAILDEVQGVE